MDLIENCKNSENCEFNEIQSEFAREIFEKLQNWKLYTQINNRLLPCKS
jgi:hypothetical protein